MNSVKLTANSHFGALLIMLIAIVSVQTGAPLAKQLFPVVGVPGATALRLLFATLILCLFCQPWRKKFGRTEMKSIIMYGLAVGTMNLLFYLSLLKIPLGIAVALEFTGPLAVAIYGSRRIVDFLWIILVVAGIILLLPIIETAENINITGILLAIGAGACWSIYIIFGKKVAVHGVDATVYGLMIATLMIFPIGIAYAGTQLINWEILPIACGVAVLSSVIPYSLEMIALKKIPVKTFGILMSLEPVAGAITGLIFLNEYLSWHQCIAISCIIIASIGTTLCSQNKSAVINEL